MCLRSRRSGVQARSSQSTTSWSTSTVRLLNGYQVSILPTSLHVSTRPLSCVAFPLRFLLKFISAYFSPVTAQTIFSARHG